MMRQAPRSMAARACSSVWMHSSRQIGRVEVALQFDVAVNVVPAERLLDHHQVVGFQALQVRPVFQAVGGIGVHHQADPGKLLAQTLRRASMSFPGLILILMRW